MTRPMDHHCPDVQVGRRLTERTLVVEASVQADVLRLCGIDPALYGEQIDPAAFVRLAIDEGVRNGMSIHGGVHLSERLVQHRPGLLGERLTVSGEIGQVQAVPRGTLVIGSTLFRGDDGQAGVSIFRHSLRPGPDMTGAPASGAPAAPSPGIADPGLLARLSTIQLTPEVVRAFSNPDNPIHFDPELARQRGYRAPIAGGALCVRYLTAEIWRHHAPRSLSLEIRCRRPVFWDDACDVMVDDREGRWTAIGLAVRGKMATEARIEEMTV